MEKSGLSTVDGHREANGIGEPEKKVNSQYLEGLEGLEARFLKSCQVDLCLDDRTLGQALQLLRETKSILLSADGSIGTGPVEEAERLWSACVLFAVKRLAGGASYEDDQPEQNLGFTLSQILKATKLSLLEFFKELPQFVAKAGPKLKSMYGPDWEKRLMVKEVQVHFYYLTVLFNYYKRLYQSLFLSVEGPRGGAAASSGLSSGTSGGSGPSIHMRFGWMLFLVLRMRVLSNFVDLVTYINALLAVVITMIVHMPPSLRKFSLDDESFFKERGEDGNVKIIASLCALYDDASAEDVSKMVEKVNTMIGDLFRKNSGFRTRSHAEQLAGIDTEGLAYFEGLMDERSIASSLRVVEKDYEEAYHSRGELDERMFINGDENAVGAVSSETPTTSGIKRKCETICTPSQAATASTGTSPSSPSSPSSSPKSISAVSNMRMPPPTPVSVTMSTVKWLRTYVSPLSSQPSQELQHFFRSCDHDISGEVTHRAQLLLKVIFSIDGVHKERDSRGTALLDSTWVEQRRLEAMKLYYRVLTAMCKAESQRLGNDNHTALLTNDRFHRCMITCAAELVLYTHKTVTMTFPAVLEPTGITAFDLSKVIESFVRHEDTLPRELKRHLNSMDQQILESMAWEKGSSLYNSLIVARKHLASAINGLGLLADPMPSLVALGSAKGEPDGVAGGVRLMSPRGGATPPPSNINGTTTPGNGVTEAGGNLLSPTRDRPSAFSAFTSPAKNRPQPPLQSVFASPQRPSPLGGGETCAETVINVFFTKVLKLAAVRIKDLCDRMHLPNQVLEQVYSTVKHILYSETSLFFCRHIDQLLLCSIYGVCKVGKSNLTFKTCIEHYGKQPQCKRQVFCNVLINSAPVKGEGKGRPQETGHIIKFYNEIFVPAIKQFLVHLGDQVTPPATISNRPGEEDRSEKDGAGPGSPKHSFPSLPDMSPKKVSPSHNVYVSPLRSMKMDTLMAPHTRSLYACVGESTQAYQSPSKDLTAINNRLNNNRRLGRLDFNGASMVSDSLVAGSLYPCNRTANSTRLTTDSILSGQSQPSWTMVAALPPSPMKRPRTDR